MATRDFDAMLAEKAGVRPTFKIGGQEFTARARIPYKRFQRVLDVMRSEETTEDEATEKFFHAAIVPADRERFFTLLNCDDDDADDAAVIDQEALNSLVQWLLEIYTGKATGSEQPSSDGSSTTGRSQKVVSLTSRTQSA